MEKEMRMGNSDWMGIYEEKRNLVYYWAYCITKNKEMAEDIVQEVFTRLWKLERSNKIVLYQDGRLNCLLKYLTTYIGRNMLKKELRFQALLEECKGMILVEMNESNDIERLLERINGDELEKTILNIPGVHSDVIFMKYGQGMAVKEIATLLNLQEKAVQKRIDRSRVVICQYLRKNAPELLQKYGLT